MHIHVHVHVCAIKAIKDPIPVLQAGHPAVSNVDL